MDTRDRLKEFLKIFDDFAGMSGLKISVEKSTFYLVGISEHHSDDILQSFPFAMGQLPVRYLGIPLLTRKITVAYYTLLLEKIRNKISMLTTHFLSFAGRLLLSSVISSIKNFWMSAFTLPSACIKELEKLCTAFLWSGPSLNTKKAKVAWKVVCRPKSEGGLGLKLLREVNKVSCLKLVWRILSTNDSCGSSGLKAT